MIRRRAVRVVARPDRRSAREPRSPRTRAEPREGRATRGEDVVRVDAVEARCLGRGRRPPSARRPRARGSRTAARPRSWRRGARRRAGRRRRGGRPASRRCSRSASSTLAVRCHFSYGSICTATSSFRASASRMTAGSRSSSGDPHPHHELTTSSTPAARISFICARSVLQSALEYDAASGVERRARDPAAAGAGAGSSGGTCRRPSASPTTGRRRSTSPPPRARAPATARVRRAL